MAKAKKSGFQCKCAVSVKDIAAAASVRAGHKVSAQVVRTARLNLAQAHCDSVFAANPKAWDAACIRNPYLPTRMIGNSYVFSASRAAKILDVVVATASADHYRRARKRYRRARAAAAAV
jgi:hypothetical protein